MAGYEKISESTFEWKIDQFMAKVDKLKQQTFKCAWGTVTLFMPEIIKNSLYTNGMYFIHCSIISASTRTAASLSNVFYHLGLINRNGQECLTLKGSAQKIGIAPMCFSSSYLDQNLENILPADILTIRLSFYKEERSDQGTQTASDLFPEKVSTKCLETLSRDFGNFYESKVDTDCVLKVGEAQFPVHRQVLAARSEVFSAMFHHDTSESRSGVVDIPDVDEAVLGDFLHYVYSGQIRGLSSETSAPMYFLADKYGLIEMRDICLDFLMNSLTLQNVCDAAVLAHTHGETELERKTVLFIEERVEELEETDEWHNFSKSKPLLANKLLRSALVACKNKKLSPK